MLLSFIAASALVAPSVVNAASSIGLPSSLPKYSKPLNKDLIGLSIEMDRWTSWAGEAIGKPNPFVNQVLSNLASLTGTPVPLRVGGERNLSAFTINADPFLEIPQPTVRTGVSSSWTSKWRTSPSLLRPRWFLTPKPSTSVSVETFTV